MHQPHNGERNGQDAATSCLFSPTLSGDGRAKHECDAVVGQDRNRCESSFPLSGGSKGADAVQPHEDLSGDSCIGGLPLRNGRPGVAGPYAYEVTNALGELELIYAERMTPDDLKRPNVPLYRGCPR